MSSLHSEHERLKAQLQRSQTDNEILRATRAPFLNETPPRIIDYSQVSQRADVNDRDFEDTDFSPERSGVGSGSARALIAQPGYLSAAATWNLLQVHPLLMSGAVDVQDVCDRLKRLARYEGSGPVFEEAVVRKVFEEMAITNGDDLL